ncbi:MAG TPA: fatty acid desaturase [Stellaceae bacterium]|nr:fatty acid desaturase [Stellaceae bacterium]
MVARSDLQRALREFTQPSLFWGTTLALADLAQYAAAIAGVLWLGPLWAKIACSVFAGLKIANLATLGHDAAHGSLTPSAALNRILGIVVFMPGLTNWALWIYEHHRRHHPYTNGALVDTYTPLSKAEYDALPRWRRALKRLHRNSLGLGFGVYYIVERWWEVKLLPRAAVPKKFHASAWRHFALLMVYLSGFLGVLMAAPLYSGTGSATAVLLGFAVPFCVWMELMSGSLYFQHTDPGIPWIKSEADRRRIPVEALTLHLSFPVWFSRYMHHVYDHPVHHVQPAIPCYRLHEAQLLLNRLSPHSVSRRFTFGLFWDTMRRCKLYDYERHRWLDFAGKPTGEMLLDHVMSSGHRVRELVPTAAE